MRVIVLADDDWQRAAILSKPANKNVTFEFVKDSLEVAAVNNADALFVLRDRINLNYFHSTGTPMFIHSVTTTLDDLQARANVCRINAWPTFLERPLWEVATNNTALVNDLFAAIGWKIIVVPDEPGFIAARILAMIINEAYYALEEGVSSSAQIDVSMRLGANHPYGPFEWADKIGVKNILTLLQKLQQDNNRYTISSALEAAGRSSEKNF